MYGVGVNGINSGNLYKLRALATGANSSSTAGKNIGLDLLLADVDQYDPTFHAQAAPLKHWANQIWNASSCAGKGVNETQRRTRQTMRRAYEEATLRIANGNGAVKTDCPNGQTAVCERTGRKLKKTMWANVVGPASAVLATLNRFGWKAKEYGVWKDDQDNVLGLQGNMPRNDTRRS